MAINQKIKLTNLLELRRDLGSSQDDLASKMNVVRQSVAKLEAGDQMDYGFVYRAFQNLKREIGNRYPVFDLQPCDGAENTYRIHFTESLDRVAPNFDEIAFKILDLNSILFQDIRQNGDLHIRYERHLTELQSTLGLMFG